MAQFQVYRNRRPSAMDVPYLLDVQTDLLPLLTRVVVPLVASERFVGRMTRLHPGWRIEEREVVMSSADLAAIPTRDLGEAVADLTSARDDILAALDFLLTGY